MKEQVEKFFSFYFTLLPLPSPPTIIMSGGGGADPPPPQWPDGGEFLLSLLRNPTNAYHHRPPHHHGDHSLHNPSSTQHHPFPSQPVPLDPAVAAVGPAIVPSNGHDRASAPWTPQAVSPPSQRPPPHLIYPHHFTARPPGPDPNHQFAHPGGDFRRGDSGRTGFIDSRLPHQFQQRDLSLGSLGFGPVDGMSSESLGFQGDRELQVMLSGAHHRDRVNSHQESRKSNLQGSLSMNKGFSTPSGYLHRNEVDSRELENQSYGNVHRMMSAVAVDRVIGGRGEREFGGQRMGYGFEGTGEKRGTRPRNSYRERNDEDSMKRNGSGGVHLFQQLDRPGLPSGSVVHSVSPARAEFLGEVGDDASGKNNGWQYEKAEGLDDLEERFNGIAVGKDVVDPINEKNQSRHLRDKV